MTTFTLATPKMQIPTTKHKLESLPKLAVDCLILVTVGFLCYHLGLKNGKSSLAPLIEAKDQQITELETKVTANGSTTPPPVVPPGTGDGVAPLGTGDGVVPLGTGDGVVPLGTGDGVVPLGTGDGVVPLGTGDGVVPLGTGDANGPITPPPPSKPTPTVFRAKLELLNQLTEELDIPRAIEKIAEQVIVEGGELADSNLNVELNFLYRTIVMRLEERPKNNDVERLFRSLQSEATGNSRVDDFIESILKTNLSRLEDDHNSELKTWSNLSAIQAEKAKELDGITATIETIKRNRNPEQGVVPQQFNELEGDLNRIAAQGILKDLHSVMEELHKTNELLYSKKLAITGTLASYTNQIDSAKQFLNSFKDSRKEVEGVQAASLQRYSNAMTQISSLNLETGSLRDEVKTVSDGYSLHVTLSSTNWTTKVFEEAKQHARRIPNKSKSLLEESQRKADTASVEQEKIGNKLKELRNNITVLEGLFPEGGQAFEAKAKGIQKEIDQLEVKQDALINAQDENSGDLIKLEAAHSEAVKLQNDALANIRLKEKILVGLFAEPVELEPSLALIGAIESELSKTTNNLNSVGTLINDRGTKLKGNITKLRDIKRKKEELEKSAFGDESETKKRAAVQELGPIVTQMIELQNEIIAINLQLKKKKEEKSKLLAIQAHLGESLAFFKPGPPPPPTDKIVLIPQGDNISQCAFIVKQVSPQEKKALFGRKSSEYSKFLKFHKEQVTHLQSTMQAVGVYSKLKAESGATDSEKYDKLLHDLFANALIESSQTSGTSEATLEATDLSGDLIVYGYARSESGTMKIYVRKLDSKPARVPLESGIAPDFPFLKKK